MSCLQIVVYHYYLTIGLPVGWYVAVQRAIGAVDGVGIFFALSGFLIGGILLDHARAPNQLQVFYVRRFFRIMPVYWILLLSFVVVRWADNHWRFGLIQFLDADVPLWHYLVFTQNNTTNLGALWLVVTWSLAVEEQFYLVFPCLVRFLSRRTLVYGAVASLAVCPLLRAQDPWADRLLLGSADRLMAGVLVALAVRDEWWNAWLRRNRTVLGFGLLVFLVATIGLAAGFNISTSRFNLMVPASGVLIYFIATESDRSPLGRCLKIAAPVGLGSYFIYLFHLPVAYVLSLWFQYPRTGTVSFAVVAFLAWLSYRLVEFPLISLGRKFRYQ